MVSHYHVFLHHAFVPLLLLLILAISSSTTTTHAASTENGEEARWLVQASKWATVAWIEGGDLKSLVMSIAESNGRIFLYLSEDITFKASLTLSEAQVDPSQFFGAKCGPDGALDPQDPRCAKLTITGVISPIEDDDSKQLALDTLFAAHPQMATWTTYTETFLPCEMKINSENGLWMIANFGGGGYMDASAYHDSDPLQHAVKGFGGGDRALEKSGACYNPGSHECECVAEKCGDTLCQATGGMWTEECSTTCECEPSASALASVGSNNADGGEHREHGGGYEHGGHGEHGEHGGGHEHGEHGGHGDHGSGEGSGGAQEVIELPLLPRPDFTVDAAGHARWIVAKSLWTTVSTLSSTNEGEPFGNIRSVVDGACFLRSSGLPYFYLPAPDPTAIDIKADERITLSFTEAALAERVGDDGNPCGGKDAEDPTCGKLTLIGHATPIDDDAQVELAKQAFKAQHPRASWLSEGGAHTGGNYYTLDLKEIMFLQNYGGFTNISPKEYLEWNADLSKLPGEVQCGMVHANLHADHEEHHHQSQSTSTSFASSSVIVIVLIASFIGSFVGGLVSERVSRSWRTKRSGYTVASSVVDSSLELEEGEEKSSKTWV